MTSRRKKRRAAREQIHRGNFAIAKAARELGRDCGAEAVQQLQFKKDLRAAITDANSKHQSLVVALMEAYDTAEPEVREEDLAQIIGIINDQRPPLPGRAYRTEGGRFAFIMPNTSKQEAFEYLETLCWRVSDRMSFFWAKSVTISGGFSAKVFDGDPINQDEELQILFSNASWALQRAKDCGGDVCLS